MEAGAFPSLLPGGRPVADDAARGEVAAAWEFVGLPDTSGRDAAGIVAAARAGEIDALVIGGVDPLDLGVPDAEAVFAAPFVVSLEVRPSAVTAYADVVLPVAWHAEKEGSFVDWEGRVRPFEAAIASGYVSDYRALDMLADEMGHFLGTRTHREISAEMAALGTGSAPRPASPNVAGVEPRGVEAGHLVLATWRHLLDAGSLQDGEPHLAGTAPAPYARISATTAAHLGLADGERVRVGLATGESVTAPVCVTEMADHVLWLPTNSAGCDLRAALATPGGDHVYVTKDGDA